MTPRTWKKIIVEADSRMTDAIAAYLAELTGSGVEISTDAAVPAAGQDGSAVNEKVTAYIPLEVSGPAADGAAQKTAAIRKFLNRLAGFFPGCPPPGFTAEEIAEEDWNRLWKNFFHAFQATPTLMIKPSWEDTGSRTGPEDGKHFVIEMDPGMAFGTGHHASTQLALLLLEQLYTEVNDNLQTVLDVGTGSGILAMACALFGAVSVEAIDNDPDAVAVAAVNIRRNNLESQVSVSGRDLAIMKPGYGLIVANIIHDTLAEMADVLSGLLAPGGHLVLAGILKGDQEDSICGVYSGKGLRHIRTMTRDEWAALLFQKT